MPKSARPNFSLSFHDKLLPFFIMCSFHHTVLSLFIARSFEVNYESIDSIQTLSNGTVVITGRDNGRGYDWDPNSYWNWLKPFRQTFNRFRDFKVRLTQYKMSNGEIVFSKATDARAVGEATLNGKKCLVTFKRYFCTLFVFFHNRTKLAMLALSPTLYSNRFPVFFFICNKICQ